ncbi:MAG: hypothetical protein O3A00_18720 [Planctomycetota bacterium]|nr:hypothetical protein [Planctomycetota bacterium]
MADQFESVAPENYWRINAGVVFDKFVQEFCQQWCSQVFADRIEGLGGTEIDFTDHEGLLATLRAEVRDGEVLDGYEIDGRPAIDVLEEKLAEYDFPTLILIATVAESPRASEGLVAWAKTMSESAGPTGVTWDNSGDSWDAPPTGWG